MPTRQQIAHETAQALAGADLSALPALLGFDGFIDDIIDVVDKRHAHDRYDRLATIAQFGRKILDAAGESCNFELVITRQKIGGNGPIMANALAVLGMRISYIGAVGGSIHHEVHPLYQDFATRVTTIPLASPAITHALEFSDGKLMMGELASLSDVTWPRMLERLGGGSGGAADALQRIITLFDSAVLLGLLNWTMMPHATDIWRHIAEEVLPRLSKRPGRRIFVDLADPKKRTADDLLAALGVLRRLNEHVPVTLGLNLSEAIQVATVLQVPAQAEALSRLAQDIRAACALDTVVIHPTDRAAAANAAAAAEFSGPFTASPKISTGAGDHFNAGFALAQLLNLPLQNALCLATATSGFYVRHAGSPTQPQLTDFLQNLPEPQPP